MSEFASDYFFTRFDGEEIHKADIREEIINYYIDAALVGQTKITDLNPGSEAYHLCDLLSELTMDIYSMVNDNVSQLLIHEATGEILDNYGDMRGIYRIGGSPALLNITFTRATGVTGEIIIRNGTNLVTPDSLTYLIDLDEEQIIIPADQNTATVPALCIYDGTLGNISAGVEFIIEDDELATKVTISEYSIEEPGVDDEEDDEYRVRILNSPNDYPIGSVDWYEHLALDTSEDGSENIVDCKVEYGAFDTSGLEALNIWFKPIDYDSSTLIVDNSVPPEYVETNSHGESSVPPITLYPGRRDLIYLFTQDKYKLVNHILRFHLSETEFVQDSDNWEFRIVLAEGYSLTNEVKARIRAKAQAYVNDLKINEEYNPYLCNEKIKELEEVFECKTYSKTTHAEVYDVIRPQNIHNSIYIDCGWIDVVEAA